MVQPFYRTQKAIEISGFKYEISGMFRNRRGFAPFHARNIHRDIRNPISNEQHPFGKFVRIARKRFERLVPVALGISSQGSSPASRRGTAVRAGGTPRKVGVVSFRTTR